MRDALERLDTLTPHDAQVWRSCDGGGLSLEEDKFELFQQRFGELVTEWLDPSLLQGEVVSDGPLSPAEMTMEVAQLLRDAGPWGRCSRSRCLMVISVCCNSGWWANVI